MVITQISCRVEDRANEEDSELFPTFDQSKACDPPEVSTEQCVIRARSAADKWRKLGFKRIFTIININYPQELNGQGLMFYSRHEEAGGSDYDEELIDYDEDDLILDDEDIPEDEYSDEVDDDEEEEEDGDGGEEILQNFYPNGTVIKFKCSQTKPTQFASWEIRFVLLKQLLNQ